MGLRRVEGCFYAQRVGPIEIIGPKGLHERERMAWYCLAVDSVGMGSHRWSYFSPFTIL